MKTIPLSQEGFSLIEMVVAIVAIGVLVVAFLPVFSTVLKGSVSIGKISAMEDIAASQVDSVLTGPFSNAVYPLSTYTPAGNTLSSTYTTTDGVTSYTATNTITCNVLNAQLLSVVNCASAIEHHVDVDVTCTGCPTVKLSGDAYDIW